jgi:ParB-like chromosome segregation protein Spo0J
MQAIQLGVIVFDAGTQVREAINEDVVTSYAECMERGDKFPPVVLFHDGNHYYMGDGFHRGLAARRSGLTEIPAIVHAGTKQDALWFALGANRTNGQRLTEEDKSHAVALALAQWPERMQREIADQVGCSESLVSKIFARNTGVGGDMRGRALHNKRRRDEVRERLSKGEKSTEIVQSMGVHSTVVADVRAEMGLSRSDKSRAAVAQRRQDIRDMAARGFTSRQIAASLGIGQDAVAVIARKEGVEIRADRVVGKTRRHDPNRIVGQMVTDAENLTADVGLIDFPALDPAQLGAWIASLTQSRQSLNSFIRRLARERRNHGQAEWHT